MRTLTLILCGAFLTGYIFTEATAMQTPKVDEFELLIQRIQKNLAEASQVTQEAQKMSAKMVEKKVEEKAELKEAVVNAESKAESVIKQMQMVEEKMEFYEVKMIGSGVDTSFTPVEYKGKIYDAYLNYVEEGGKEDFEYFRLYIWQGK